MRTYIEGYTDHITIKRGGPKRISTHTRTAGPTPGFRFLVGTGISSLVPVSRQALGPPDLLA
jgi:hypothetical protein